MDLLRVLGLGDLAGADGPHRLVGDDPEAGLLGQLAQDGAHLALDHLERLAGLALLQRLAHADDGAEPGGGRSGGLAGDALVGLAEELAPLAVAEDDPGGARRP